MTTPPRWASELVILRLEGAAATLRVLKAGENRYLASVGATWVDTAAEKQGYGYAPSVVSLPKASSEDIALYDECEGWVRRWLSADTRPADLPEDIGRVVWARASGFTWNKIAAIRKVKHKVKGHKRGGKSPIPGGNSRESLRQIYESAIAHLVLELNKAGVAVKGVGRGS